LRPLDNLLDSRIYPEFFKEEVKFRTKIYEKEGIV
jgi:hypothetical protein